MIDCLMTLHIEVSGHEENIQMFGSIDERKREVEFHYEIKTIGSMLLRAENLWGKKFVLSVKGTDSHLYCIYYCVFIQQTTSLSSSGMGTLKGKYERLIKQDDPHDKYNTIFFSFDGIEKAFRLSEFQINREGEDKSLSIILPTVDKSKITIDGEYSGSIFSYYQGVPTGPCEEIHIVQKELIEISTYNERTAEEMLDTLLKIKRYLEFLLSQEIQLSSISFVLDNGIKIADVISDNILIPHTFVKPINDHSYPWTNEDFFSGLCGWLENYSMLSRVIDIWQKTIYNTNVTDEDVFIWRCQAFELICLLIPDIKEEAFRQLAPDQANPNLRNFLSVVNKKFGFVKTDEKQFAVVKDARDKLTHNNPRKEVTGNQMKNAFMLIHHFLLATMAKIMNIKVKLPMVFSIL